MRCIRLAQGAALDEVLAFFPAMLAAGSSSATFDSMLPALLAAGNAPDTSKTAQHNIARCIASLTGRTSQQQATLLSRASYFSCRSAMLYASPNLCISNSDCLTAGRQPQVCVLVAPYAGSDSA